MNCPFHITIYKTQAAQLPRAAACATPSSAPSTASSARACCTACMRVRGFTQDDAHLFCRPDQLDAEIVRVLDFVTGDAAGLRLRALRHLPSRPSPTKASGTDEQWERGHGGAQEGARDARPAPTQVDPGEGAFYGPKIDIKIKDSLDRAWQCSTIQVDFHNPKRFEPRVHRRGRQGPPAGDDAPRAAGQPGALLRRADRALRRRFPALAGARAGRGHPGGRGASRLRAAGGREAARPRACASTWTTATRRWATRSAKPRSRRSPTCSWWGTRKSSARAASPLRHRHAGDLGPRTSPTFAERRSRASSAERAIAEEEPARAWEVSHRQQDGPNQRPHPRQGSPRHRRRRGPARHHAARTGAHASPRKRGSTSWRSRPRPRRRSAGS